ncbi:hyaluronoglucosaminidase 6 isoform X1 [Dunckerocampus dactyliophorus]|uniref:hyaluronoglucosaminidase 6 isoform X1 n=1 Tax=Dunckerocampus dactyliophorus TaxID=161453 RepID=UPI002404B1BB|nr:hyaluronoglucosaminidase 6 isoform X1 [Dunckerocampus dactyliophorus]
MASLGLRVLALALWLSPGARGDSTKPARAPLIPHRPFVVVWNAPTEPCRLRFQVDLDLSVFDIVANLNETLSGPNVTIFYHSHLGYYPYYSNCGTPINGGLPQNQSISKHLSKARNDIDKLIPHKDFRGLGVIDWENWRPQWVRNWGTKDIYRNKSKEQIRKLHPNWPESKVEKEAKENFERAGQAFMNLTLALAEGRRPAGLWGFYLFPDCYNYGYKQHPQRYSGECPNVEHVRNDHLMWLWKESTALYPSIYLDYELKSSANTVKFVHYRVKEAMRIASIARPDVTLPVFVYSRPFYAYTFVVLSESDLVHTIGESAALGASGVVLWGSSEYARTQVPPSEELFDSEEVHRRCARPLRGQRHIGRQAVQQSFVQEKWPLHPQEPRLGRLPPPEPALLQHPPPAHDRRPPPLPRHGSPEQSGHPGHEAQVHLPVLPGLDRRPLRGAADSCAHTPRRPSASWPVGRPAAVPHASFLLPVHHHAAGTHQVSLSVDHHNNMKKYPLRLSTSFHLMETKETFSKKKYANGKSQLGHKTPK